MASANLLTMTPTDWHQPQMWACMETCAHMGKYVDRFPTGGIRCMYGMRMDGTSGNEMFTETDMTGRIHFFCRYYEEGADDQTGD